MLYFVFSVFLFLCLNVLTLQHIGHFKHCFGLGNSIGNNTRNSNILLYIAIVDKNNLSYFKKTYFKYQIHKESHLSYSAALYWFVLPGTYHGYRTFYLYLDNKTSK